MAQLTHPGSALMPAGCRCTCPVRVARSARALQRCSAASYSNSTPSTSTALHRVFVFDASNPDSTVQELLVEPHADIEAAEEMLQQEAINLQQHGRDQGGVGHAQYTSAGSVAGSLRGGQGGGAAQPRRTPMPLRGSTPPPARGATPIARRLTSGRSLNGSRPGQADLVLAAQANSGLAGRDPSVAMAKTSEMQKQLVAQLEREQGQVAHLQQYEGMYRQWRIKAERLDSDLDAMQRLVAEKDAELAHGYRLLEASAAERSRLRHAFQAAQDRSRQLQLSLDEAAALAITDGGQPQARLGAGPQPQAALPPGADGQGPAAAGSITASLQTAIEELTLLATDLATDMSFEVRTLSRGVGPLPPRLNFESGDESS